MNRPDPEFPDQGANQDDAVWLDLVSRLQEQPQVPPHEQHRPAAPGPGPAQATGSPNRPSNDAAPPAAPPASQPGFAAFDPLGLTGPGRPEASAERDRARGTDAPAGPGPRDYIPDEEPGEFVPEEPPSLAGAEPLTVLAWLGAVGGPVTLLLFAMFWRSAPLLAILGVIAGFIAAVGYLIMRLPQDKNDSDDGARV